MSSSARDDETPNFTDDAKPSPTYLQRAGVAFLAGGTSAIVALLFVPLVTVTTSVEFSLAQLLAFAVAVGILVTVDSARQPTPRHVVVRTSYFVTILVVLSGLVLGGYVWTQLAPEQTQGNQLLRYAPLAPITLGLVLGGLIGGFGTLYNRRTEPQAYE